MQRFAVGITALLFLAGCVQVAPWERGRLAKPHMALDPNPNQSAIQEHVYSSREAGGGIKGAGGGCGCY
ncbi:MAG: DUF4266 domain-containing protein [Methylohalobius sp.]|nr:DUF4266 domain-containing protein [Methylohalobius sp.]